MRPPSSTPEIMKNEAGRGWLNRTVLGIGLASLFSDWSHEIATTLMPAFLASMGVAAAWLGIIEGVSDGLSSFAKMGSGYYTDRLPRRKFVAGAIVGPLTAFWLLGAFDHHYPRLFAVTLVPSLLATGFIIFLVVEKRRAPTPSGTSRRPPRHHGSTL